MQVIVRKKVGRPAGVMPQTKMAVSDRASLESEINDLEIQKKDISYETSSQEKDQLERRLIVVKEALAKDEDAIAKGRKRDALLIRQGQLAERIKVLVPPLSIQKAKPNTPEYIKAMDWGRKACEVGTVRLCEEYQNISRMVDPENPNAGSIEALVANS